MQQAQNDAVKDWPVVNRSELDSRAKISTAVIGYERIPIDAGVSRISAAAAMHRPVVTRSRRSTAEGASTSRE